MCAHAGANSFFLRRVMRACVSRALRLARALRPPLTSVKRERLAIPTRSQPSMRGPPHIAENFEIEILEARCRTGSVLSREFER